MSLRDQGAGMPDGGLFTAEQVDAKTGHLPGRGLVPARGVIEVKPLEEVADSAPKLVGSGWPA